MEELSEFLIKHMILDFDGDVDGDILQRFLIKDGSPIAQSLRGRLSADGPDDFLIVLSDCLREYIRSGISAEVVKSQIATYVDS